MRFFIPSANDTSHAEAVYEGIRRKLSDSYGSIKNRRIESVRFEEDGKVLTLAVGDSFRRVGGEPVIAILEGEESYFVCTSHHGSDTGEPYRISRTQVVYTSDFTAVA